MVGLQKPRLPFGKYNSPHVRDVATESDGAVSYTNLATYKANSPWSKRQPPLLSCQPPSLKRQKWGFAMKAS